ncbi:MAG: AbrB/MazE/SpoVT family DNA-binding domain-containing protein [Nitrososphaerales archaeon]
MEKVRVDEKGRVIIPKRLREKAKVKEGCYVKMEARERSIIIEPIEPLADKYL